jgi:uncharacterized iron-regulated protein
LPLPTSGELCYNLDMLKTYLPKLSLFLGILLAFSGCSINHVMRVENREIIGVQTMLGELHDAPVILVGERHDAAAHHELQLQVIKSLKESGKSVAIGMEMFEGASQKALDAWTAGKAPEEAIRKVYGANWRNLPWELYADILRYARANRIPIIALNAPRSIVQKVSQQGFAGLTPGDLSLLPPGINAQASDAYLEFMRGAYSAHGRSGESFRNIYEAQMLRNKVMARRVVDYLTLHPESTVVVLAGGGHARKEGGIPAELGGLRYRVVLPTIPGLNAKTVTKKDGDYLLEEPYAWLELIF